MRKITDFAHTNQTKQMTHTRTHWKIGNPNPRTHATPIRWEGENIAWVCGLDSAHEFSPAQTLQNARLIAAAPEMLAALKDAEFLLRKAGLMAGPMRDSFNRSASDAREAITKAEGNA
jgi:hypothetical protein